MKLCVRMRYFDLTIGTAGYRAAMASHRHKNYKPWQNGRAEASITSTDQQEEAQWKETTPCDPENV